MPRPNRVNRSLRSRARTFAASLTHRARLTEATPVSRHSGFGLADWRFLAAASCEPGAGDWHAGLGRRGRTAARAGGQRLGAAAAPPCLGADVCDGRTGSEAWPCAGEPHLRDDQAFGPALRKE